MNQQTLDLRADIIDVRDLTDLLDRPAPSDPDEFAVYLQVVDLLEGLAGEGGDHQWHGTWYPAYLVADDHFIDYAKRLAEDIGAVDLHATWPIKHIDWEAAARALRSDYSLVVVGGLEYWYPTR